ncbi:MAG: alanyl-tRNA editing protein [Chloroflexi bacterium]|nr:alanyl-tRNA editing protein [Chloroflexota bacterium]
MTDRLYYSDSYARQFTAHVLERLTFEDRPALVLDRTLFYPASGGQPFDTGRLHGSPVVDVAIRESDKAVLHWLSQPVEGDEVTGEIDWPRRFDHMQQHTGQHILSQAFLRAANAETVSFHLGLESVTIDLNAEKLSAPALEAAETIANEAVTANLPVRAWFPAPDELASLPLRKTPDVDGPLRVVAIGEFDTNACGGTHVAHTGEVGLIKILKVEREKKATRVEFRCGARALADYRLKNTLVNQLAADFTCGISEVTQSVAKLRAEAQSYHKELKAARETLLAREADGLAAASPALNGRRVIRQAWADRDPNEVRGLAVQLAALPGTVALLGTAGAKAHLVFARAEDAPGDMNAALKTALAMFGGRGGGNAKLAQGGGVSADAAQIESALRQAESELFKR